MRYVLGVFALVLVACGKETTAPVTPKPVGPASVIIVSATSRYVPLNYDEITIHLTNNGGGGAFYLEFWALPSAPNGSSRKTTSQTVSITAGYDETLVYRVTNLNEIQAVKVKTQPVNTAIYSQTDCVVLRSYPAYCP